MGAPEYVPLSTAAVRSYRSAPRRPGSWMADRPGELEGRQPVGERLGSPGPDQGYVLTLARRFEGKVHLGDGEHEADALAGAAAIGLKRASLFGRAPVIDDVRIGLALWRWLDESPPADLAEARREMFEEAHHPHHYDKLRAIVDAVSADTLVRPTATVMGAAAGDWRSVLDVDRGPEG